MGYLFHILAAIGLLAAAEVRLGTDWRLPWLLPLLLPVPHLLGARAKASAMAGRFRRAELSARLLQLSPLLLHGVAVLVCGWAESIRLWTGHEFQMFAWPRLTSGLAFVPFVVFELVAIDAYARVHQATEQERGRVRAFQVRMFLSGLAPLVVYLLVASMVGWSDSLRIHVERIALLNAIFVGLLLVLLASFLPRLLQGTWDTAPLGRGPVRELFEAVAERASFRARDLLVWRTGNLMANAAIVGLFPRSRVVLFSDSLLSMLGPRELAAVFAHEIGHAMRHHVAVFMAWVAAFFLGGDLIVNWLLEQLESDSTWLAGGLGVGVFVLWFLVFGWLSRRFELEADLYSIDLLGDTPGMISALERVGGRLRDVAGWRHFSTADRIAFLLRASSDPSFARRFRARLRFFSLGGALLAGVALIGQGFQLAASWTEDRVVADLCLGRYRSAAQRLAQVEAQAKGDEQDEWLQQLVAEGEQLEEQLQRPANTDDLGAALERALASTDYPRAAGLAGLLELREAPGASGLTLVLGALADGDRELAQASFEERRGLDERWVHLLDSHLATQ